MKKTISLAFAAALGLSVFAADIFTYVPLNSNVKAYTKTEYSIASKFGNYFRTPSLKIKRSFENGNEIESAEMTPKDVLQNKISSVYDESGKIREQSYINSESEVVWKNSFVYNAEGLKSEVSEFNAKDELKSKTIFTYEKGNLVDETIYDAEGAIVWKTVYKYNALGKKDTVCEYSADGKLSSQETYAYDNSDANEIDTITIYDKFEGTQTQKVFRYNAENQLSEITTYNNANQISNRVIIKYDTDGNVSRVSEYNVAEKFGTTVNELIGMAEYSYEF